MSQKDYKKYAYFISKAKNFAIAIKPDKKKIVDGEVVFEPGLRLEFNNGMLRIEKTKENESIIKKLREKIEMEKVIDPKRRTFFEEEAPKEMISIEKVEEILNKENEEKDRKIKELEEKLAKSKTSK